MFKTLKILKHQGKQFIPDLANVSLPAIHAGMPEISDIACKESCMVCAEVCPVNAITTAPVTIDLAKCVFCVECQNECPEKKINFTSSYKIASNDPELLKVSDNKTIEWNPDKVRSEIKRVFGRSLKLRLVSDGSCNGCELELNAADNVNFDMSRYGIEFVASPRHADGIVITGAMVENSVKALELTFEAIPQPKVVILCGACALSGGIFAGSPALNRSFIEKYKPDLYLPGCPPHPLTIIDGLMRLTGRRK